MRIVDLFCGIGGVAEASRQLGCGSIVSAIDIDQLSNRVYLLNHGVVPLCRTLESIESLPHGDVIWMSPPCQPYTRRGSQRGADDSRSAALAHLIMLLEQQPPKTLLLENVPDFCDSPHHHALTEVLKSHSYHIHHEMLCPTQWGVPMRRKRFYLRASRHERDVAPIAFSDEKQNASSLISYLDPDAWSDSALTVEPTLVERYKSAMDILDIEDDNAIAACFTSAYGESPVRAGSYLRCRQHNQVRRFSAEEIVSLMGYRDGFQWPETCTMRQQYRMLGNALSVQVTNALLRTCHGRADNRPF
ncbi:MAG: DNA cytosine methyltransferase [Planctomycetota bacterium]